MRDLSKNNGEVGSPGDSLPPRRRRTANPTASAGGNNSRASVGEERQLRHSPQHYLDEYNKNAKNYVLDGSGAGNSASNNSSHHLAAHNMPAPHSTGGFGISRGQTASDIYYAQYKNHIPQQQQQQQQHPQQYHFNSSTDNNTPSVVPLHRVSSAPNAHASSFQHFEKSFHLNPNPLAAVHFRKAVHVADKDYRVYMHGHGRDTTPVMNPVCCANTCAGFSFVGFLFMLFIGILLDTQPLFIGGALPSTQKENDSGKTSTIYFVTAERLPLASHAYQTSIAYMMTMVGCLVFVYSERVNSMLRRRSYQEIPDAMSPPNTPGSTAGVAGGGGDGNLPDYLHRDAEAYRHMSPWNRVVSNASVKLRETTARVWNGRAKNTRKTRKKNAKTI